MTTRRPRHSRERGQAVPIIAIMATLLVAVTSLMVDLSLQTHNRRSLQNLTDAAALAGARELGPTAKQSDRIDAALQALAVMHTQMWPGLFGSNWVSQSVQSGTCNNGGSTCDDTIVPPAPASNYTIQIHIPPISSANNVYTGKWGYVEVDLSQTTTNTFAGVMGFKTSTQGAHSIAYHFATNQAFGFALYANSWVGTGNAIEPIQGPVYANRYINPQSDGKAGFCADGNSYIIFGSPQYPDSSYAYDGQLQTQSSKPPYPILTTTSCSNAAAGGVYQTGTALANGQDCSGVVSGVTFTGSWYGGNGGLQACVANPPIVAPTMEPPTDSYTFDPSQPSTAYCSTASGNGNGTANGKYQPGVYACASDVALQVNQPLQSGLYVIYHENGNQCTPDRNCYDVQINQNASLAGVTFWLMNGASIGIATGASVSLTPYSRAGSNNPGDQGVYSIYTDGNSASTLQLTNGAQFSTTGTLYMQNGVVNVDANSNIIINPGQAIVGQWSVQSGYHPNPDITYNGSNAAPQREVLKLVE